jgi:hypothetical protein
MAQPQQQNLVIQPTYMHTEYPLYQEYYQQYAHRDSEMSGLMPNIYDLGFVLGMVFFIILMFVFFMTRMNMVIYILMVVVTIVPIYVVYLDVQNSDKSNTRMLGNVCAGIWIAIQIGVLFVFGLMLL